MIKKYLLWIIAIAYLLNPFDIVPDFLLGAGWIDDLSIIALVVWWISRMKRIHKTGRASSYSYRKEQQSTDNKRYPDDDPYKILGIKQGASKEEIRSAYNRLIVQYHPDKVQHLGQEFQEMAHNKFISIQKAYETLLR
ncbi:MAG: DnaJ domain-containing protein [Spirochaetota bacterium]|nr:DnaJ domain-containing protein [Spirochaetota bacterium]